MIQNPILPGFNPDPCICRKGDDYYMAVSTFEWFPGIPVYHSRDLKNWELYTHVLTDDEEVNLKKLPSAKGVWAPCLTYCEEEEMFYVVYGVMNSMNARYFDVDNFLICSKDIKGPWSKPVYLHSAGFDASLLQYWIKWLKCCFPLMIAFWGIRSVRIGLSVNNPKSILDWSLDGFMIVITYSLLSTVAMTLIFKEFRFFLFRILKIKK